MSTSDDPKEKKDGTSLGPLLKRKGLSGAELSKVSGLSESKIKRIVNLITPLESCSYETLRTLADCFGIPTVDDFIKVAKESADYSRTEKMDAIIRRLATHEANSGKISWTDMWDVLKEAKKRHHFSAASIEKKKKLFLVVFKDQTPDKILLSFGLTEIHAPDGELLYEIQS